MTIRVGINGFGRMGRLALRAAFGRSDISIVHINEYEGNAETAAHLLTFDSVHGTWDVPVQADNNAIIVGDQHIVITDHNCPQDIPWADTQVDIVLECSGAFRSVETLQPHIDAGAKKVIVACPVKKDVLNIVMGINDDCYHTETNHIVTAASCTTNCLAPVVKVIRDGLGIKHGVITTIHDATNTQVVVDKPHKDLRRARAGSLSLIPTSTGSATAITMIYPDLLGKLNGLAVRVPLLNASLTDVVFEVERPTSVEEVNRLFADAATGALTGILGYEERPLVSVDYVNDTRSCIIDALSTMVVDGTSVKVLAWYDNEIGYVHRMVELTQKIAASL